MKKILRYLPMIAMAVMISGCGGTTERPAGAFESESISTVSQSENEDDGANAEDEQQVPGDETVTDDQALDAIKNYCHINIPELQKIEDEGEYPVGWEIQSSDDTQIVVLFRSYTGALVRYYIDPVSGDTYATEYVEGITPEEMRTEVSFNIREYIE